MAAAEDGQAALKALQDVIYRDKVLRARAMTPEQRWAEAVELTNCAFQRMLAGAMWQLGTEDSRVGWAEVRRRLDRLCKTHDHGMFVNEQPPAHDR